MDFTISKYFGLAILDVVLYSVLMLWMSIMVGMARRKHKVKYPAAYENKEDSVFNRYQRAHYNAVENAPLYFATLLVSAVRAPIMSGIAGFVYVIGRYIYCQGYYADIKSRRKGMALHFPAQGVLLCICAYMGVELLMS